MRGPSHKPARGPIFSARQTDGSLATGCWSKDDGHHFVHAAFCWRGRQVTVCVAPTCEKCPPPGECSSFAARDVWMNRMCPIASAALMTCFCLPSVFSPLVFNWRSAGQWAIAPMVQYKLNCVSSRPDMVISFLEKLRRRTQKELRAEFCWIDLVDPVSGPSIHQIPLLHLPCSNTSTHHHKSCPPNPHLYPSPWLWGTLHDWDLGIV